MGISASWGSVIDSLSAGYRFLGRRVSLILIPVLLDLWLWLGPRLSIQPLIQDFVRYYEQTVGMQDMPTMPAEMSPQILLDYGQASNLMDSLVSGSVAHVPSLFASMIPVSFREAIMISSPWAAFGLFAGLSLLGLWIGVLYMNLLAQRLPLGEASKPLSAGDLLRLVIRQWLKMILFIIVLTAFLFAGMIPVILGSVLLSFINPALSSVLVAVYIGAVLVVLFYLYFATAAIVLDDLPVHRAILQSVIVVRSNFIGTLIFIMLTVVIANGMMLILRQIMQVSEYGLLVAIPVNAYIGTGIVLALFVYYRTQLLRFASLQSEVAMTGKGRKSE